MKFNQVNNSISKNDKPEGAFVFQSLLPFLFSLCFYFSRLLFSTDFFVSPSPQQNVITLRVLLFFCPSQLVLVLYHPHPLISSTIKKISQHVHHTKKFLIDKLKILMTYILYERKKKETNNTILHLT